MDSWQRFNETLPDKKEFYSNLNIEDIAEDDFKHVKEYEYADIDKLQTVEQEIRGGIFHAIHQCAKANNEYMKNYNKDKESSYLIHWDANSLYGWTMSQKLPADNFEWEENASSFYERFIKIMMKIITKDT